jgi:hypothetical protein
MENTCSRSSVLCIERRLIVFVSHLLAHVSDFGAHLEHGPPDAAPHRKITTRRAACRHARKVRQHGASNAVD